MRLWKAVQEKQARSRSKPAKVDPNAARIDLDGLSLDPAS
jgi:hypothetical protein